MPCLVMSYQQGLDWKKAHIGKELRSGASATGFHVRITSKLSCDIAQRTEQRSRQRIHRRTVESQRHDAAVVTFHQYEVVGHAPRRY